MSQKRRPNIKTKRKRKRAKTAAEKRAARKRRKETMIVFINGKQKRVPRPQLIDGLEVDEFIRRNADPIWIHQNEMWELMPEFEEFGLPTLEREEETELEYSMYQNLNELVSKALHTLLSETLFRAQPHGGYLLNGGEPGMVETLKGLTAQQVSRLPGKDRKPIVGHANHVLFYVELMNRAVHGDETAFAGANWKTAWELTSVNESKWADLLSRLERTAKEVLEAAPAIKQWEETMLTGVFACAAHTAYHLGAIRQIMRDMEITPTTTSI